MVFSSYLYPPAFISEPRPPIQPDNIYVNFPEFPERGGSVFCQISISQDLNENYAGHLTWYDAATLKIFEVTHWLYSYYVPDQGYRFDSYEWELLNDGEVKDSFNLTFYEVEGAFSRFGIVFQGRFPYREQNRIEIRNWGTDTENPKLFVLNIQNAQRWERYVSIVQR